MHEALPEGVNPERAVWIPGQPPGWGRVLIVFDDFTTADYGPVRESDIRTARDLLLDVGGGPLRSGDGVGLVGLDNPAPHLTLEGQRIKTVGRRFDVVMHPALVDSPIGRSAVMVDALPINDRLVELVGEHVPHAQDDVAELLNALRGARTWKFTDRETWVTRTGAAIRLLTDPSDFDVLEDRFLSVRSFSGPDRYAQAWAFSGTEGEAVTFELDSEDLDAYLYVTGPGLEEPAEDDDSGEDGGARVELVLPATGDYRVIAGSFWGNETGEYTLTARSGIDAAHGGTPDVEAVVTMGMLRAEETQLQTLAPGEFGHAWTFLGVEGEAVTFELESDDFDAYLYLSGPGLEAPLTNDDGGDGTDARLGLVLPANGEYRITASSLGGNGDGEYTVSARSGVDVAARREIRFDELRTTEGQIRNGEVRHGRLEAIDVGHAWAFSGVRGDAVTFELGSEDFDAYLYVTGPGLEEAVEDDDGGRGDNARVEMVLPNTGQYRVIVSSFWGDEAGEYTLTARGGIDAEHGGRAGIERVPTIGMLEPGETQRRALALGEFGQAWVFRGIEGQEVTFELRSDDLDAYLYVDGPGFDAPLSNDDGGDGTNARLDVVLPASGEYRVVASSFLGAGDGEYLLSASRAGTRDDVESEGLSALEGKVQVGEVQQRRLEAAAVGHAWEFAGIEGEPLILELGSDDFDAYMYVTGPGLEQPLWDDDGGDGTNSRIEFVPGSSDSYRVIVSSFLGDGAGVYSLSVGVGGAETQVTSPFELFPVQGRVLALGDTVRSALSSADAQNVGGGGRVEADFGAAFAAIRASADDFERLNDFAESFAFVRWVAWAGVSWIGWPNVVTWTESDSDRIRRFTPQRLVVTESGFESAGEVDGTSHMLAILEQVATRSLPRGEAVSGELADASYVWEPRDSLVEGWRFDVAGGEDVVVRATSSAFDAWLWILGPGLGVERMPTRNGEDYVEARWQAREAGTHYVVVEDLVQVGGSYALRVDAGRGSDRELEGVRGR